MNKSSLVILFFLLSFVGFPQKNSINKGDLLFSSYSYSYAIKYYLKAIKQGYKNPDIYQKIGNAYYFNNDFKQAYNWFKKYFDTANDIPPIYYFKYAQALKSQGKHAEAKDLLKKMQVLEKENPEFGALARQVAYPDSVQTMTSLLDVKNLNLNSKSSEFSPSIHQDKLYFVSARDTGTYTKLRTKWGRSPFLDLFSVPLPTDIHNNFDTDAIKKLPKTINSKIHESSIIFTKDGKTMYFTRNNSKKGKVRRDKKGISRLKLYKSVLKDNGNWGDAIELPFNSKKYSVAHPALSLDEKQLYFVSNMPGSIGKSDIWVVDILSNDAYSKPRNLGPDVNTKQRESFPFISSKNNLYFASDGHPGFGALDMFVTKIEKNGFGKVVNLGKPVNSGYDDFSFIINPENKTGFFASNRKGGRGKDDLYVFKIGKDFVIRCKRIITGLVTDIETQEILSGAAVQLIDGNGEHGKAIETMEDGTYQFEIDCEQETTAISGVKLGYEMQTQTLTAVKDKDTIQIHLRLIKEIDAPIGGYTLKDLINLGPINFGFDSSRLRTKNQRELEKIANFLQEQPDMEVMVQGHTDSRGKDAYNQKLSERRANTVAKYLAANGADSKNISTKGYGESKAAVDCTHGCNEKDHAKNRRTDIVLSKSGYTVQVAALKTKEASEEILQIPNLMRHTYEDGYTRYYVGIFKSKDAALDHKAFLSETYKLEGFVRFIDAGELE
ncbi:MAG: OmpA family protein [Flavobacteriaceae bacterium]|nr:OmpA family protein [Flavobacteriaceae bacterium]